MKSYTCELAMHQLILRYNHTRIYKNPALNNLARSFESYGQLTPVLVVPEKENRFVLIDGYSRFKVAKMCLKDNILAKVVEDSEESVLLSVFANSESNNWEVIEQASLLNEMVLRFELSLDKVAQKTGRDKSWVKRRLDLVRDLPEEILIAITKGQLSVWAASRIMSPLARANKEHAKLLMEHLKKDPLSTRDLSLFYNHYKQSGKSVRSKMIKNPTLFIKSKHEIERQQQAKNIIEVPEGVWLKDIKIIYHILIRLKKQLKTVFHPEQEALDRKELLDALNEAHTLLKFIYREVNHD